MTQPTSELKTGAVLVANPFMDKDLFFRRSVILLFDYDKNGAYGVNIATAPGDGGMHQGGPMSFPGPIVLHDANVPTNLLTFFLVDTGYAWTVCKTIDEKIEPADIIALPSSMLFKGYAGWSAGQLRNEIKMGVWRLTTTSLDTLLKTPPEERWSTAERDMVTN